MRYKNKCAFLIYFLNKIKNLVKKREREERKIFLFLEKIYL